VARKPYSIHFSRRPRFLSSSQLKCSLENANCPLWKRNNFRSSSKTKAGSFPTGEPRAFVHLIQNREIAAFGFARVLGEM
jgi:hypothetical protein